MRTQHFNRKGFTLLDLVIVVAIVATMAAILFPAFVRARDNARKGICQSNLKQIGLAATIYRQEFDDRLPARVGNGRSWTISEGAAAGETYWGAFYLPYAKSPEFWSCPNAGGESLKSSYGVNGYLAGTPGRKAGISGAGVQDPAGTIFAHDAAAPRLDGSANLVDATTMGNARSETWRHNDTCNVLWYDGHVTAAARTGEFPRSWYTPAAD